MDWTDSGSRVVYEHENPEARAVELVESAVEDWQPYETVFIDIRFGGASPPGLSMNLFPPMISPEKP